VGSAAVTKLTLDRLGKGELDGTYLFLAYVGLVAFVVGVGILVGSVIWQARSGRVTLNYLLSDGYFASRIRKLIDGNPYLLGGQPDLESLQKRLNKLAKLRRPLAETTADERTRLLEARDVTLLPTARAERARMVSTWATVFLFVGALLAALGAATFALATNADLIKREDRVAQEERDRQKVVTGEFLPKTPSSVLVVVPTEHRAELSPLLGKECELGQLNAILLDVGQPPTNAVPKAVDSAVFHVVTERSTPCSVVELWLPISWVIPRPVPAPAASPPKTTTTEPASPAPATAGTTAATNP
jgi:hypothetical protein